VPGLSKAKNVQSVVTPALADHIDLVGDGMDVEHSAHLADKLDERHMALKVRSDQAIFARRSTLTGMREEAAEDGGTETGSASGTRSGRLHG